MSFHKEGVWGWFQHALYRSRKGKVEEMAVVVVVGEASGLEIMSYSRRKVWLERNMHPIKPERGS